MRKYYIVWKSDGKFHYEGPYIGKVDAGLAALAKLEDHPSLKIVDEYQFQGVKGHELARLN